MRASKCELSSIAGSTNADESTDSFPLLMNEVVAGLSKMFEEVGLTHGNDLIDLITLCLSPVSEGS